MTGFLWFSEKVKTFLDAGDLDGAGALITNATLDKEFRLLDLPESVLNQARREWHDLYEKRARGEA